MVAAVAEVGRWLGHGGAILVNLFNPRVIVLGGYFAELADQLLPVGAGGAGAPGRRRAPPARCHFVASHLGFAAAARGAAGVVVDRMIDDPVAIDSAPSVRPASSSPGPDRPLIDPDLISP